MSRENHLSELVLKLFLTLCRWSKEISHHLDSYAGCCVRFRVIEQCKSEETKDL